MLEDKLRLRFARKLIRAGNNIYLWSLKLYNGCSRNGTVEDFSADLTDIKTEKLATAIREGEGEVGGKQALDLLKRVLKAYDSVSYYIESYKISFIHPDLSSYCDQHIAWISDKGIHINYYGKSLKANIKNCDDICNKNKEICPAYQAYKLAEKGHVKLIREK
jgi:hypothetical protein